MVSRNQAGFTMIEVLVVVLIVGILAAIALPTFLSQKEKAVDVSGKSDARNLQTQVEGCYLETSDWNKCDSAAEVADSGLDWGTGRGQVQVLVDPYGLSGVAFTATSKKGTLFAILKLSGANAVERVCQTPNGRYPSGGCRAGGSYSAYGFGQW